MLTYRGAWKLVQQNPLSKLLPVDEYLPIMFNKHPEYDRVLFSLSFCIYAVYISKVNAVHADYTGV